MKHLFLIIALCLPGPVRAQDWGGLAGSWRGEGVARVPGEADQRLRCSLRLNPDGVARAVLTGRCVSTQTSRSFSLTLWDRGDGVIEAENRMETEGTFPDRVTGHMDAQGLVLSPDAQSEFTLRATDQGALLTLGGPAPQNAGRFEAQVPLRRTDGS